MPYRSGVFQTALGSICAVAFIISNAFGSTHSKQKRVFGTVQRISNDRFLLTEDNSRQHKFALSEPITVFLNETEISFDKVENGRRAAVLYNQRKGHFFATHIDVFPTHADFELTEPKTGM